ncbi:Mu-like prophage major head subunit gpT family protein [Pasteurella atlantica]|uniref:Mu-like prophage major head subunit gpT family protein n=1 Tax=Phocoenobacter atlanticus TaxID=3416742 RepID=UPI001BC9DE98|nr:Mu-like prophage major head subunit gpT family protein [Pasteurella atlantica]MDP8160628.1 Mu-like prophage major head subunit gpT family protein [Pasteurella atlantica]QVE21728.1 Mu-like prophage major head subunit gpT family protein [Pasteurella atlantica]
MAIIDNANLKVLNTSFNKIFNDALKSVEPEYQKVATVVTSNTASNTYGWLGEMPELTEWVGERDIKNFKTYDYNIPNKLFESSIGVARVHIEDDNLGQYNMRFTSLARRAAQHPDKLVFDFLKNGDKNNCYDGKKFFATNHPVFAKHDGTGAKTDVANMVAGEQAAWFLLDTSQPLKPLIFQQRQAIELTAMTKLDDESVFMKDEFRYGVRARHNAGYGFWQMAYMSKQELTPENFNAAVSAMMSQTADGGRPLNIKPTLLVVPPSLRAKALEIVKAERLANGETNINKDLVDVLVTQEVM